MVKKRKTMLASKANNNQASLAEKTETILLTMPRIIATQIGKDLINQKQLESKLKAELKELQLYDKKLMQKVLELKKKNTMAAKKQVITAQKALQKNSQLIRAQTKNIELIQKQVEMLSQKKAKYTALQAQLVIFQRDWGKKMIKKTPTKAKLAVKAKPRPMGQKSPTRQNVLSEVTSNPQANPQAARVIEMVGVAVQDKMEHTQEVIAAEKLG